MAMAIRIPQLWRLAKGIITNRWMVVVSTFFIMACSGATYNFGIYSDVIKTSMGYNQETLNTLGFFKDLGANVGIFSGLLYDITGPWVVLTCGAVLNLFGYLMIWLAVEHKISRPAIWEMCLFICIGANSQAFTNTGVIVTSVKNFPNNRGLVIGLLKGYVGLSGAMLTLLYRALYGDSPANFILLIAWLPCLICLVFLFVIRRMPPSGPDQAAAEKKIFTVFLLIALVLAGYLMVVIIVTHQVKVPRIGYQLLALLMVMIVMMLLGIVVRDELRKMKDAKASQGAKTGDNGLISNSNSKELELTAGKNGSGDSPHSSKKSLPDWTESLQEKPQKQGTLLPGRTCDKIESNTAINPQEVAKKESDPIPHESREQVRTTDENGSNSEHKMESGSDALAIDKQTEKSKSVLDWKKLRRICWERPPRGSDYNIPDAIFTIDMFLIFIATTCGVGGGLMAIDNLGQIGKALDLQVDTFVSLISIWNFLGRVGSGFASEIALQRWGIPRTFFFSTVIGVAAIGHLVIALNLPGALFAGSILIGLTFGAQWALMYTIISEIFGLKYYGTFTVNQGAVSRGKLPC